jgi:hypothetical protein
MWDSTYQFVLTLLGSAAVSAAVTAGLVWFAKEWIGQKVKSAIQHEYDEKLETLRATLAANAEVSIEKIRTDNAKLLAAQSVAAGAFTAAHAAAHERRLHAVETIWRAVGQLKEDMPLAVGMLPLLGEDALAQLKKNPQAKQAVSALTLEATVQWFKPALAQAVSARPFVSDYLYQLFHAYYVLPVRMAVLIRLGVDNDSMPPWQHDEQIQSVAKSVLSPEDMISFNETGIGLMLFMLKVEPMMVSEARKVISGDLASEAAIAASKKIQDALAATKTGVA